VGGALVFLLFVCFYVQYEDLNDQEKSEQLRNATLRRAAASAAMGVPRMGPSYATQPSPATIRTAAEAVANAASRSQPEQVLAVAAPKARAAAAARAAGTAASAVQAAEESMVALSNSMNNITGMLAGENVNGKKFGSPDLSTASGASSPRSTSTHSAHSRSLVKNQGICSGSVLIAHVHEAIFASSESWQEIGQLTPGQQVIAAGPPEVTEAYTMVPIKPRGAVDLKTLVVHEY